MTRTTFLILLAFLAAGVQADSITLKRGVRMPVDRDHLMLGDIATLDGPAAASHRDLVIWTSPDPAALQTIELTAIRAALDAAEVRWAEVHLSGSDVLVRPRTAPGANRPVAMRGAAIDDITTEAGPATEPVEHLASALVNEPTLRGVIARRIVQVLERDPADVRLTFDPQQARSLEASIDDFEVEFDPLSSISTDRVEIILRLWRDGRVDRTETATIHPLLRTAVATLARDVSRGDTISAADVNELIEWRRPSEARGAADVRSVAGRMVNRSMRAGAALLDRDLEQPAAIRRGDRVVVRCISGGIVITLEAEARSDGVVGEPIELRKLGERATFFADVTAPGEAVIDLRR